MKEEVLKTMIWPDLVAIVCVANVAGLGSLVSSNLLIKLGNVDFANKGENG